MEPGEGRRQYDSLAGKIGMVIRVSEEENPRVVLQLSSGATVTGTSADGLVSGIVPLEDIDSAKARYIGRRLWANGPYLGKLNAAEDTSLLFVDVAAPVTVVDVVPGVAQEKPVRFIVRTASGEQGYADVHMSNTNIAPGLRPRDAFRDVFTEFAPHVVRVWQRQVRDAIADRRVVTGMSREQIRMAWGEPEEVYGLEERPDAQEWVYQGTHHLIVEKDRLVEVGN